MADQERIVDGQLGIQAGEAVDLGGNRNVVKSREILDVYPGRPVGGEAAGDAQLAQFAGRSLDFGPGLRRLTVVELCSAEQVLVVVEDRRRRIERERQQIAVNIGVITRYRGQESIAVELDPLTPHQFEYRIDRPPGSHHGGGADLVHLHDRRLGVGAHRETRRGNDFRIVALIKGNDPLVGLRRSEEHTSELQSRENLVCRLLLEKKKKKTISKSGSKTKKKKKNKQ